ncbi:type VI secretion system protein ImpL [Panacagrimonas perspica]|uniref:Type VI secretion system protein ImpL n=1 Tax=Panacagrimonas perspica TaxID=381431 RepID=A0A4R7PAS1_9GAMM|nr:type VI secretion system membrane subunit TssM [Panacagrimonas perspica]TDU31163.1 type VI secretion system protein ImpL [Panacagrimonas perspica]THD01710.1 type VI secretion protein [Panacagrimonas perspica]
MSKIFGFFTHPLLITLIGMIAAALVIWYVGPLIAVGSIRPFEPEWVRWTLILLVALVLIGRRVWRFTRAKMASRKLMEGLTKSPANRPAGPSESQQEIQLLGQRFEEAVATLRKVRLEGRGGRVSGLIARSSSQYLYELPWYVFIGPPGSGKTTALINSGLKFPLAEKLGSQSIKGVGGTRNCDWWFTDEAVLIDTAGRYTTQDSDQNVDKAAWDGFLDLLKKFRPRRPINGILLTISASDMLTQSPRERAAHAEAARARIGELYERLQIRFPIYVLVTKVDLLAGFTEFFSDLSKEERAQVWGTSFTFSQEPNAPDPLPSLDGEWAGLLRRLFDRQPQRLRDEKDLQKRALIFGFPQQVAALKPAVLDFLGQVFVTSRFGAAPLLRGMYFTSGTQEGRPIDRVVGNIARAFGFDGSPLALQTSSGRSYFLTRLLNDVIFEEQALAGTNIKWEKRRLAIKWGAYIACAVLGVGLLAAWAISYGRNSSYIKDVDQRTNVVKQQVSDLPAKADTNVVALLPVLDAVRGLPRTDAVADGAPMSMTYGLYQGTKLQAGADQAYRSLLRNAFLPRLIYRIEDRLRSIPANDLEQTYEVLKVYLMLQDRTHLEPEYAAAAIEFDWDESLPRSVTTDQRAALGEHLKTLLAQDDYSSPLPPDPLLIASARSALTRFGLPQRVYSRLKREGIGADYPEFSVATKGGPSASLVFQRVSNQPLTKGVPGLYSYNGYHSGFLSRVGEVSKQLGDEQSWVLGTADPSALDQAKDLLGGEGVSEQVRRLYLQDYVRVWEEFIADVKLKKATSLSESIQTARILSAPDSPIPLLMRAIVRETTLATKQDAEKDITDKATDKINQKKDQLAKLFGGDKKKDDSPTAGKTLESIVDDRFASLRYWVMGPGDGVPSPMDGALKLVNDVYVMLSNTETAVQSGNPPPPSDAPARVKAEAARMPDPFKSMLQDLSGVGSSQALQETRNNLSKGIAQSFGDFCAKAINGRYPFSASSAKDVTSDDFAALFASGGMIDQYFQQSLSQYVDTATKPWSLKKVEGVPMGYAGSLANFERADGIKKVFFRMGSQASYRYEFKPVNMDAGITRFLLDVDGQSVNYAHGPVQPKWISWPGPGGASIVRLTVEPAGASGSGYTTEGPWALFRLFDKAKVERTAQPEKMFITFSFDGRDVRFEVTAGSVQNPYGLQDLRSFSCPRGLN